MEEALHFGTTALEPGLLDPDRVRVRVGQRINNRPSQSRLPPLAQISVGTVAQFSVGANSQNL